MENVQTDPVLWFGGEVKALDDAGRIGGYLVRFSTAKDPDMVGDFFTAKTDFGPQKSTPILYHHGLDRALKTRILGDAAITTDDVGAPGILNVFQLQRMLFGVMIVLFLVLEPRGLFGLWIRARNYFKAWPFSY